MAQTTMRDAAVLIVEDDHIVAQLIADLFGGEVFALQVAGSISEAQRMVGCSLPDLIILDAGLPDGDGMELCAEWRQKEKTQRVPVLFLTGRSDDEDHVRGLLCGGNDFMTKPFRPKDLLARAQALVCRQAPAP